MHTTMAAPNPTTLKFSLLLIILLAFESREASLINHRIKITIVNNIVIPPNHPTNITVHCKSKDDDLGFHTINFGDRYIFSFNPHFFLRTLFFCSFTWPRNPHRHYLDIYDQSQDHCNDCTWLINQTGGCLNSRKCGTWKSIELIDATNNFMWP
jgi:hypothetical protein